MMLLIINPSLVQAHCLSVQAQLQNNGYLCNKYRYFFIVQSFFLTYYVFAKEITAKKITPKKKQEISTPSALLSNSAAATLVRLSLCH